MKRKRLSGNQIISILNEPAAGMKVKDITHGTQHSQTGLYRWKKQVGNMDVSDARKLKSLEAECQA